MSSLSLFLFPLLSLVSLLFCSFSFLFSFSSSTFCLISASYFSLFSSSFISSVIFFSFFHISIVLYQCCTYNLHIFSLSHFSLLYSFFLLYIVCLSFSILSLLSALESWLNDLSHRILLCFSNSISLQFSSA